MPRCEFTAKATEDLREIGKYTRREWGLLQARRYRQQLELALQRLSCSPGIGLVRDEIGPNMRSFRVASHIAFYLPKPDGITVLRLLHPGMDVDHALAKDAETSQRRER